MIDLKELIQSGEFCLVKALDYDGEYNLQIKINNFYQLDFNSVDDIEELEEIDVDSNVWIMDLTVVNLNKSSVDFDEIKSHIKLVDEEDFQFDVLEDSHLCGYSEFAVSSGLSKLYSTKVKPKIPKSGSLAFELPELFEGLGLTVDEGSIEYL